MKSLFLNSFLVSVLGLTSEQVWAKNTPAYGQQIDKVVKELPVGLKKAMSELSRLTDYKKVNSDSLRCIVLKRNVGQHSKQPTVKKMYTLNLNSNCMESGGFKNQELIKKDVYFIASEFWLKSQKRKVRSGLISLIYKKAFFALEQKYSLNLDQDINGMVADFLATSAIAYKNDAENFKEQFSDVKALVEYLLVNKKDDISALESSLEQMSLKRPLMARLKIIYNNDEAWFIRYKLLKEAKKSIRVQSYSLFNDIYGRATVALMLEALQRGVSVDLMLDGRGSMMTKRTDLVQILVRRGARVSTYNPMLLTAFNVVKYFNAGVIDGVAAANHDKLMIVDNRYFVTGGRNIGTSYFAKDGEVEGRVYKDIDVFLDCKTSPTSAIAAFNAEFYGSGAVELGDFDVDEAIESDVQRALSFVEARMLGKEVSSDLKNEYAAEMKIASLTNYNRFNSSPSSEYVAVEGIDKTSVLLGENALTEEIYKQIDTAQTITIMNPYVVLTKGLYDRLKNAVKRGAQVNILTTSPVSTDSLLTQADLISNWREILQDIPEIHFVAAKGPENVHAKIFIFDSKIALVGSYNLDKLSEQINSEYDLKIESEEYASEIEKYILGFAKDNGLVYNHENNVGPHSFEGGEKKYKKMKRFIWLSKLFNPWL